MGVAHRLLAVSAAQIGVHHAPHDGPRPHDADLDDQVVVITGFEPGQHGHLRAALDLEAPHGIGLADHGEGGGIVLRDRGEREVPAPVLPDETKGPVDDGQHAEPEQVDLEETQVFQVFFVPLDDRAIGHGAVLDGDQVGYRLVAEQESAGVNGQVAGKVLDFRHQLEKVPMRARIEAGALKQRRLHPLVMVQQPGDAVDGCFGQSQRLAYVPDGGTAAVADEVGHHGGVGPAVLAVEVLDDLLAAVVLNVQVDVGRLGPLPGNKALKQQVHARGSTAVMLRQ